MSGRRWYEPPPEPYRTILTWGASVLLVIIVVLIVIGLTA
jgi:hypothetical protein